MNFFVTKKRYLGDSMHFSSEYVKTVSVCLNPEASASQMVTIEVDFFKNDKDVFSNVHIKTGNYGVNSHRTSTYVPISEFQKAFTHMEEVAYLLAKNTEIEDFYPNFRL